MTDKHPHHDIIIAWLNGETVERQIDGEWDELPTWQERGHSVLPSFSSIIKYRIQPRPKTGFYRNFLVRGGHVGVKFAYDINNHDFPAERRNDFIRWLGDWQTLEL
jgi:hypothetical protein